MLNLRLLLNIITIAFLVFLQVFVFDKITLNQVACPYIYIIFILLYPPQNNRYLFLFLSFLLGWGVDFFNDTGGIHAFASLTIAYLSKFIIRMVSGTRFFEPEEFKFSDFSAGQWFIYIVLMVFIHHFLLYFMESFSFDNMQGVMMKTLYSSILTILFVVFYLILFRKKETR